MEKWYLAPCKCKGIPGKKKSSIFMITEVLKMNFILYPEESDIWRKKKPQVKNTFLIWTLYAFIR